MRGGMREEQKREEQKATTTTNVRRRRRLNHLGRSLVHGLVDLRPFPGASGNAAAARGDGERGAEGEGVHGFEG